MTCGEKGFTTVSGEPCGQIINPKAAACLWHSRTAPERRMLALRGAAASALKSAPAVLDPNTPMPALDSPDGVLREIASTVQDVRTGRLDEKKGAVVLQGISVALKLAELRLAAMVGDLERRLRVRRA